MTPAPFAQRRCFNVKEADMLKDLTWKIAVLATMLSTAILAAPATAHHGFRGAYDATRPLYIEGVVRRMTIAYPHVEMTIEVQETATVPAELPDIGNLGIADIMQTISVVEPGRYDLQIAGTEFVVNLQGRVAEGERVALVALRNCLPPNEYRSRWIRIANGEVVSNSGATQAEVQGCDG